MRALHTAATGMKAQELNVQVISNNIANMRTTGYKRQRAEFQDLLYEHVRRVGTQTSDQGNQLPAGVELGSGVKTVSTPRLMTQGSLVQTGKDYDVAIRGEGFFQITLPDGRTAYSRDGSFELDSQGRIVTAQGNVLNPGLTIPQNATLVTINAQGQVAATLPGNTTPTIAGDTGTQVGTSGNVVVQSGTGNTVVNGNHTHDKGSLAVSSHLHDNGTLAVSSHLHAAGTLATDTAARPPSLGGLLYFRR